MQASARRGGGVGDFCVSRMCVGAPCMSALPGARPRIAAALDRLTDREELGVIGARLWKGSVSVEHLSPQVFKRLTGRSGRSEGERGAR